VQRSGVIPSLDGLRALSIAAVVIAHAKVPHAVSGSVGVGIFFFISGFLITTLLRRELERTGRVSLRRFYERRALRIFPPLYLVLAAAIVLEAVGVIHGRMTAGGVASAGTFTANYFIVFGDRSGIPGQMGVLWSLAVEEHYYLVFPLVFVAMARWLPRRRTQAVVLAVVCVAVLAWRCWLRYQGASDIRLYYATDTRLDAILWGAVVALALNPLYGEAPRWLTSRRAATPLAVAAGLVVCAVSRMPSSIAYTAGYTVQSLATVVGVVAVVAVPESLAGRVLNLRPVIWLGVISYSLYLLHRPALAIAQQASTHVWTWTALAVLASVLLAEAVRRCVENPLRRWRARLHSPAEQVTSEDGLVTDDVSPGVGANRP
jgi:peptidoglycan/LPS O-acetylase OafA/YrhL